MTQPFEVFLLTREERKILLTDRMISKPLQKKLKSVSASVDEHIFPFSEDELAEILFIAQDRIANSNNDNTIHTLTTMLDRLSERLPPPEEMDPEILDEETLKETAAFFGSLPDDVKQNLTQLIQGSESCDSEETIKATTDIILKYAMQSASGITDLSGDQLFELVEGKWNSSTSPVFLEWKLEPDEIEHVFMLRMAKELVSFMFDNKGRIRLDKKDNISSQEMKKLLRQMNLPPDVMEIYRSYGKTIEEWRVLPVYKAHLAMLYSDVFQQVENDLILSPMGIRIFEKEQFGRLLVKMFRCLFQKVDLSFLVPEAESFEFFQDFIPLFLYRLSKGFDQWVTIEDSVDRIATEAILEQMGMERDEFMTILMNGLYMPLKEFGLLEIEGVYSTKSPIRKTPLYDRFIRFNFPEPDSKVIPLPLR